MTNQQLSLRWNNYLMSVTSAFDSLQSHGDLVDVTLCCEGKKIKAHRMLLSACSTYFKDIFKENPCSHPVIIFRNVKFDDLSAIIYFIYHGEVSVSHNQLASFLITAEMLQIQGLTDNFEDSENDTQIKRTNEVKLADSEIEMVSNPKKPKIYSRNDIDIDDKSNVGPVIQNVDIVSAATDVVLHIQKEDAQKAEVRKDIVGNTILFKADERIVTEETANEGQSMERGTISISAETLRDFQLNEQSQDGGLVKFRCHVCWKGFKHPTSLTLHKDAHTGKTQCPVCRRSFSRSYDMRNHLQRIHQDQPSTAD